jgi:hypothetical protein
VSRRERTPARSIIERFLPGRIHVTKSCRSTCRLARDQRGTRVGGEEGRTTGGGDGWGAEGGREREREMANTQPTSSANSCTARIVPQLCSLATLP